MKRLFFFLFLIGFCAAAKSQSLYYVNFHDGSTVSVLSYITDQKIVIKLTPDGKITEWGNDMEQGRMFYQKGKLQQYMGRVDYYSRQFDTIINGKVKSIGTTFITYYGSTENKAFVGKVRSIGNVFFEYYSDFENEALRGKLKTAGSKSITYYSLFENDAFKGKMKSLGGQNITYYSTFDDKAVKGKVKSIGTFNYSWYTSFESRYRSGLKSGSIEQLIEGVTYILW